MTGSVIASGFAGVHGAKKLGEIEMYYDLKSEDTML